VIPKILFITSEKGLRVFHQRSVVLNNTSVQTRKHLDNSNIGLLIIMQCLIHCQGCTT